MKRFHPLIIALLTVALLGQSGCAVIHYELHSLPPDFAVTDTLASELRVHTHAGEVIIFPSGVQFDDEYIYGDGRMYGLNPELQSTPIKRIPRDSVAYLVAADKKTDPVMSAVASIGSMAIIGAVIFVVAFAIAFGNSCVYGGCD